MRLPKKQVQFIPLMRRGIEKVVTKSPPHRKSIELCTLLPTSFILTRIPKQTLFLRPKKAYSIPSIKTIILYHGN